MCTHLLLRLYYFEGCQHFLQIRYLPGDRQFSPAKPNEHKQTCHPSSERLHYRLRRLLPITTGFNSQSGCLGPISEFSSFCIPVLASRFASKHHQSPGQSIFSSGKYSLSSFANPLLLKA